MHVSQEKKENWDWFRKLNLCEWLFQEKLNKRWAPHEDTGGQGQPLVVGDCLVARVPAPEYVHFKREVLISIKSFNFPSKLNWIWRFLWTYSLPWQPMKWKSLMKLLLTPESESRLGTKAENNIEWISLRQRSLCSYCSSYLILFEFLQQRILEDIVSLSLSAVGLIHL